MTNGGYTFEEALRLQDIKPGAPGPVTDAPTIRTLLDVVAVLLSADNPERTFTFDEIMAELRTCLDAGQTVADEIVRPLLPGASFVAVDGGYKYRTEPQLCETCSAWSELIARSEGGRPVEALCLNPKSPCHGQYKAGAGGCAHWSDDPALADYPSNRAPGAIRA